MALITPTVMPSTTAMNAAAMTSRIVIQRARVSFGRTS